MSGGVDLLLTMDDDLMARLHGKANVEGIDVEEWLRRTLMTTAGMPYRPLVDEDLAVMRPMVVLDLRS